MATLTDLIDRLEEVIRQRTDASNLIEDVSVAVSAEPVQAALRNLDLGSPLAEEAHKELRYAIGLLTSLDLFEQAHALVSLAMARADARSQRQVHLLGGLVAYDEGDLAKADAHFQEALLGGAPPHDPIERATATLNIANVRRRQGEHERALLNAQNVQNMIPRPVASYDDDWAAIAAHVYWLRRGLAAERRERRDPELDVDPPGSRYLELAGLMPDERLRYSESSRRSRFVVASLLIAKLDVALSENNITVADRIIDSLETLAQRVVAQHGVPAAEASWFKLRVAEADYTTALHWQDLSRLVAAAARYVDALSDLRRTGRESRHSSLVLSVNETIAGIELARSNGLEGEFRVLAEELGRRSSTLRESLGQESVSSGIAQSDYAFAVTELARTLASDKVDDAVRALETVQEHSHLFGDIRPDVETLVRAQLSALRGSTPEQGEASGVLGSTTLVKNRTLVTEAGWSGGAYATWGEAARQVRMGPGKNVTSGHPRLPAAGETQVLATRTRRPHISDDYLDRKLEGHWRIEVALDAVGAAVSVGVMLGLGRHYANAPALFFLAALPLVWPSAIALMGGYNAAHSSSGPHGYRPILTSVMWLLGGLGLLGYVSAATIWPWFLVGTLLISVGFSLVARAVHYRRIRRQRLSGRGLRRLLVVGRADAAVSIIERFDHEPQHGLVAVGACVPPEHVELSHLHGVPVVGDLDHTLQAVDELGIDVVAVVSHPDLSGHALRRLAWALEEHNVELIVWPGIVEVAAPRLSIRPVAGMSLLQVERPAMSGGRRIAKRAFDAVFGSLLLVLAAPTMLVIAVAIRLEDGGPALFRQTRMGAKSRPFTMLKFRSMLVDAEHRKSLLVHLSEGNDVLFKLRDDPRITRVGSFIRRFSLDELPQLLNVVRGDMSLVGPRPPLPEEAAAYSKDAARRLRVRPGITGLWQVSGRSDLSWEESLLLDLRYVDNWSLMLDVTILWRTLRAVLLGSGSY